MEKSTLKKSGLNILLLIFTLSFLLLANRNKIDSNELVLFDFEQEKQYAQIKNQDASFEIIEENNDHELLVHSGYTIREAGVKLMSPENKPWNLSPYYQVKADITNKGDNEMQVELFVGNDPDGLLRWYCSDYIDLKPGETKTLTVDLAWTPWIFKPEIEVNGLRGIPGQIKADLSKVTELTFCSRYATKQNHFSVDNVRAIGSYEERSPDGFFPFVDAYGQYVHEDWKNKIHSDEELLQRSKQEQEHLMKSAGPLDRGTYGGWSKGPKLEATGFFRTEKVDGKWWMVDPEGYLFWTAGLNCVASDAVATGISHREKYFEFLPEEETALGQFYGEGTHASHGFYKDKLPYTSYSFYQSNLYRKYGDDWLESFQRTAHLRIKDWGMNTIGFMSDFGATRMHKTPYVGSVWIRNTPKIEGSEGFWGKFHDVFDPSFRAAVKASMASQKEGANDPWCIGYFVDNELSWGLSGSLSIGVLKSPANQAAKIEFVADLKNKYKTIAQLNKTWRSSYSSWSDVQESTQVPDASKAEDDLLAFYEKIADTYFRIINEELKAIAPNQNYLGCRFAWANNDIVLNAAGKYLDIMSFNKYEYSVENFSLPEGLDKPVMIGEFHFGALDQGSFHVGIKKAIDQKERGTLFKNYIQGALRHPNIVGAHWFQYIDEPNTGRFDGENYNVGFIDICDNPYEDLIKVVKETTYEMYSYRKEQ